MIDQHVARITELNTHIQKCIPEAQECLQNLQKAEDLDEYKLNNIAMWQVCFKAIVLQTQLSNEIHLLHTALHQDASERAQRTHQVVEDTAIGLTKLVEVIEDMAQLQVPNGC